jgi:Flp pilus assembly protein CpaB
VFGGFLVAVAVVGIVAAQQAASGPPSTRYVVAAATLPAGRTIGPGDLATRAVDLPEPLARRAYQDPRSLVGRVLAATVAEGELVQGSDLAARGPRAGEREVSFTADPARSLGQRIGPGDVVDVYATTGQGEGGTTELVARGARVIDRQARQGAAGFIYTVALVDPEAVETLVRAAAAGSLTVVRATAATPSASASGGG